MYQHSVRRRSGARPTPLPPPRPAPPDASPESAARGALLTAPTRPLPAEPRRQPDVRPDPAAADERFMDLALAEARAARQADEVPVGAVVVLEGEVIGRGHNRTRAEADPTQHAEIVAVRAAARALGAQRLVGATVYTTVEPCFMCAGALAHARVARVVWAVRDPKFGGCA